MKRRVAIAKYALAAVSIFGFGFLVIIFIANNEHYWYNLDSSLSPIGMLLAKTYLDPFENAPEGFQGYIENGEFAVYKNWPP